MNKQDEFEIIKKALCQLGFDDIKLEAELNQDNKSHFEKELRSLVDGVDIIKGTEVLDKMSATPGDFVDEEETPPQNELPVQNTDNLTSEEDLVNTSESVDTKIPGIDFVRSRIEHYLVKSGITKNILVEYSLLSSTLEPTNPDKLQCISFVLGEKDFKKRINTYYTESIRKTNSEGFSVYQHPRFLYNIDLNYKKYDLFKLADDDTETSDWADNIGVTGTVKLNGTNGTGNGNRYKIDTTEADYKAGTYKEIDGMYVDAFKLDRSFNEMLKDAKKLDVSCDTSPNRLNRLVDIQNTLHSYCHRNISRERGKNSAYISFPIYGSRASNQLPKYEIIRKDGKKALQGIGAFFIYFEPEVDLDKKNPHIQKLIEFIMTKIAYEMGNFIRLISANYMFNLGLQLQENARKEALKSARSAIMSRNMSHNLGSHVMSYLKQSLSSVQRILDDRLLALLFEDNDDMLRNIKDDLYKKIQDEENEKGALPFLVGLGRFISYLQERQDFIATIATDFIPYLSTVNFKDFIYDELNPDKRYERHKDRKNFKTDNILLGNIARSEGLGRPTSPTITLSKDGDKDKEESKLNDIIIKFRSFDGNPVKDSYGNVQNESGNDALNHMRDYDLSLPGGVVGRQAIFSIIENTIRNAAKHGNWRDKGKLGLTFDIFTKDELSIYKEIKQLEKEIENKKKNGQETIDVEDQKGDKIKNLEKSHQGIVSLLEDNSTGLSLWEVFEKFYMEAKDSKDLYYITLTDNLNTDDTQLMKLRKAINEPLINERGEMNEASKGIKEMRISSTWLRGLNESETYNPIRNDEKDSSKLQSEDKWVKISNEQNAPALYARISNGHLQYIFCVLRPKRVAIVSSRFPQEEENLGKEKLNEIYNTDAFLRNSWSAFHPIDYINEKNKSYEFVIYEEPDNSDESYWFDLRYVSSSRLLKLSDTPLSSVLFDNIRKPFGDSEDELKSERDFYHGMLCTLYRHFSGYNKKEDFILIDDKKTKARIFNEKEFKPFEAISIIDGQFKDVNNDTKEGNWYIYRTHHDSAEEFKKFITEEDGKIFKYGVYVEGITGNNSTDRLIRNEKLDEEWFYRHIHAMKEKVAIFDERIFTKVYGIEEADLTTSITDWTTIESELSEKYFDDNKIDNWDEQDKLIASPNWHDMLKQKYEKEVALRTCVQSKDALDAKTGYVPTSYSQKGIFVFSFIRDPQNDSMFNLYGIKRNIKDGIPIDSNVYETHVSVCQKIAEFRWISDKLEINWLDKSEIFFKEKFNHISIHQGLLDKLYNVFRIKDNDELKEKLTQELYEEFSLYKPVKVKEEFVNNRIRIKEISDEEKEKTAGSNCFSLLPGMCIHSGRSKPSKIDMPQRLPFIQYASIENAVADCKYSMIELLDYARYE